MPLLLEVKVNDDDDNVVVVVMFAPAVDADVVDKGCKSVALLKSKDEVDELVCGGGESKLNVNLDDDALLVLAAGVVTFFVVV